MNTDTKINFRPATLKLIQTVNEILNEYDMPLTVRQIYYRLVAALIIENSVKSYKNLDVKLVNARRTRLIPYSRITDRTRRPIKSPSWTSLYNFLGDVKRSYKRERWSTQEVYIEVWLEKEALANLFEAITDYYDVQLVVGHGYQSQSALFDASKRFQLEDRDIHILYFGDFDPTGEDIPRAIQQSLTEEFHLNPIVEKISLTRNDITEYNLPPNLTKKSDPRSKKFIAQHGDISVELDALPPNVLVQKLKASIEGLLDKSLFELELQREKVEVEKLQEFIDEYQGGVI